MASAQLNACFLQKKCFLCDNYLSVPPITDVYSSNSIKQKCGRCKDVSDAFTTRNTFLEEIAKHFSFPCSFENCGESISWGNVLKHEEICPFRNFMCPLSRQCLENNIKMNHMIHSSAT